MRWNKQQELAIRTTNRNILVAASAGAGKTTILVARLMKRILEDGVEVDQILAMTFSEAAASEMKNRLLSSLSAEYQINPSEYLKRQITLLPSASISTIHSFCLSILKNYYYVLPLQPERLNFILDEATQAIYQETALNSVIKKAFADNNAAFITLCDLLSAKPLDYSMLRTTIIKLSKEALKHLDYATWLDNSLAMYQNYSSIKDIPEPLQSYIWSYYRLICDQYTSMLSELLNHIALQYYDCDQLINIVKSKHEKSLLLSEAINCQDYSQFVNLFTTFTSDPLPSAPEKNDLLFTKLRKDIHDFAQKVVTELFDETILLADITCLKVPLQALCDLVKQYITAFNQLKENHKCIDFNDMEMFAYQILSKNNSQIANELKLRYSDILVDEFQDSNQIQDAITNLICRSDNVFRVGDIKQSIYRFRGAKPALMRALTHNVKPNDTLLYLNHNYRSKKHIVQFNNHLFDVLMNLSRFDSEYTSQDFVSVGTDQQNIDSAPIEFCLLNEAELKSKEMSKNELKASYIAQKIIELQENSGSKWSDYVVLVRSHQTKLHLKKAFTSANIPHFISLESGFYKSKSVVTILSYCKLLLDPNDDIAFVSVFLNLYNHSNDELAQIALNKPSYMSYYDYLQDTDMLIMTDLWQTQQMITTKSLTELFDLLYAINDYYTTYCDQQQRTNLDLLYEKAINYQQNHSSLLSFMEYIAKVTEEKTSEAIPISSEDNVVKVMTIHQSKGLQFSTVLFWSSFSQSNQDIKDFIVTDGLLGFAGNTIILPERFRRPNIIRNAINHKNKKESLEEEVRILYVALTRAQNRMVIVDSFSTLPFSQKIDYTDVFNYIGYSGWIYRSLSNICPSLYNLNIISDFSLKSLLEMANLTVDKQLSYNLAITTTNILSPSTIQKAAPHKSLRFGASIGNEIGSALHKTIELLPNTLWSEQLIRELNPNISSSHLKALLAFSSSAIYNETLNMTIEKELPFIVNISENIINGYMDFVAYDENKCILIDFKSDNLKTKTEFLSMYTQQMSLYNQALHIMYPNRQILCYIYSLSNSEFIEIE